LSIPALVNELRDLHRKELEAAAQLPTHATYRFDRTVSKTMDLSCPAHKMTRRTVVSLYFSRFQAKDVIDAAQRYENAWDIFQNLRDVLRLSLASDAPLHDRYLLNVDEQRQVHESLTELRETYRQRCHEEGDSDQSKPYQIVVDHLDKYWSHLLPQAEVDGEASTPSPERTTNGLESHWGQCKRGRRKTHGRSKLTRDLQAMPQEYMLIPNLENPRYVELVLGSLDQLPQKLAEAGRTAGPFSHWQRQQQPLNLGRLPKRLLRKDNFIDHLFGTYDDQCQASLHGP